MRQLLLHLDILGKQVLDVNQTATIIEYVDTGQKLDTVSHCQEKSRRIAVTPVTPSLHHMSEDRRVSTNKQRIQFIYLFHY